VRPVGIDQSHTFKTGCGGFLFPWLPIWVPPPPKFGVTLTRCFLFKSCFYQLCVFKKKAISYSVIIDLFLRFGLRRIV